MARTRTTKKLAQRIDLNYFKRPTAYKRARFWLSLLLPVAALLWIAWRGAAKDSRVYSSGRMSEAHAVLEKECATCHVQRAGAFSAKAADSACVACHDGPPHHSVRQVGDSSGIACSACHTEHRGRSNIAAVSNEACAQCHGNLAAHATISAMPVHVHSFNRDHPDFAAVAKDIRDPGTIRLNHAIHLKPIRRGPNGPSVQLQCGDCHRDATTAASWPYSDAKYASASHAYSDQDELRVAATGGLAPRNPKTGRELMAPVKFATACAACHSLTFDKHFDEGVPHDAPEVVHAFVTKKFQEYIATHPGDLRVIRDPARGLTGKPLPPDVRVLTPVQWVAERTTDAEQLLWRKTCKQCHTIGLNPKDQPAHLAQTAVTASATDPLSARALPRIEHAKITLRWLTHAKFDHDAHRGFTCISCHEKALTSTESSDVLLPGIATCQTCHAPGADHAESRCFECHTYHDWSQRKEVTPQFTLPQLRTGGR
jgi:hypothetical protein